MPSAMDAVDRLQSASIEPDACRYRINYEIIEKNSCYALVICYNLERNAIVACDELGM